MVKRLRIDYALDGKPATAIVDENETIELAQQPETTRIRSFEITSESGGPQLLAWQPGDYRVGMSSGQSRTVHVADSPTTLTLPGPWKLRFPAGWGAPPEVILDRLISWTEHPNAGVRYFSGTAEYETQFTVSPQILASNRTVVLDLGAVKNLAEVRLNGRDLGILWKSPFALDLGSVLKPGRNTLNVKVTNLWPNRLIGDEQLPPEVQWNGPAISQWPDWLVNGQPRPKTGRYTFTTWRFYTKNSPLLESGLIGPVVIRSARRIDLR